MNKLFGTGVALVTPLTSTGAIDFDGLKKLLNHTAKGVDYFVVMGTTGESATLSKTEKKTILEFVKRNNRKNLPLVFGIGGNNTEEVINNIQETDLAGVEAILSVSPYYNKPSQEGIYQHFKRIASKSPVPIILYNVPGRTGSNLTAETSLRLAKHKNIIGIKEASGNMEQCMRIAAKKPTDFMLISGDDLLTVPLYSIGAVGVISVLANAFPTTFKRIKDACFAKDFNKASRELFTLLDINGPMYEEGNPVGIKHTLHLLEICENHVRLPLVPASDNLKKKIKQLFAGFK